jgi:hypothetical protein
MGQKLFKIRDKVTGKYWNGDVRRSTFNDAGKSWKKRDQAENAVGYFLRYRSRYSFQTTHSLPDSWEIVEVELVEKEVSKSDMTEFLKFQLLRNELEKIDSSFVYFVEKMRAKKVLDKIEFLLALKPAEDAYYVDMSRIVEARSQIRGLGIKTRTFREGNGVFGMMDRQQALRARLTLDVKHVVDLAALRTKLGI